MVDTTVNGALIFGPKLVQAVTSDNVQILALAACEIFGSTIAMCPATCDRIQRDVIPPSPAPIVTFLKATVGWSTNDCATYFGNSEAGLRFLGLAAALVTTMGHIDAGKAISLMLPPVAKELTQVPPPAHVKDLLESLEPRLNRALFTERVVGWHHMGLGQLTQGARYESSHPSHEAISKIVDAFRKLCRVGDASINKVRIQVAVECVPWVIAFTEWCLGVPPSVFGRDKTPLLEPEGSNVDLFTGSADDLRVIVTLEHDLPLGPEELIAAEDCPKPWLGMVTVSNYGYLMRQKWQIEEESQQQQGMDPAFRAFVSCLAYGGRRFLQYCRLSSIHEGPYHPSSKPQRVQVTKDYRTSPFNDPGGNTLARILTRLLYLQKPAEPFTLDECEEIDPIPHITKRHVVRDHLEGLRRVCICQLCRGHVATAGEISSDPYGVNCLRNTFLYNVSLLLADALAISLFQSAGERPNMLVRVDNRSVLRSSPFQKAVEAALTGPDYCIHHIGRTRRIFACNIESLAQWALALAGHDVGIILPEHLSKSSWAMSCFRGQAIYPAIFESGQVTKNGYFTLALLPGVLMFEGQRYTIIRGQKAEQKMPPRGNDETVSEWEVDRPLNSRPDIRRLKWTVDAGDRVLTLGVSLVGSPAPAPPLSLFTYDPFGVISILADSLVVERCAHRRSEYLEGPDFDCAYTSPTLPAPQHGKHTVSVVASDEADHLRFYSLLGIQRIAGKQPNVVVRIDACLKCCLSVCRQMDSKWLVC